jgi:hypothetical protein
MVWWAGWFDELEIWERWILMNEKQWLGDFCGSRLFWDVWILNIQSPKPRFPGFHKGSSWLNLSELIMAIFALSRKRLNIFCFNLRVFYSYERSTYCLPSNNILGHLVNFKRYTESIRGNRIQIREWKYQVCKKLPDDCGFYSREDSRPKYVHNLNLLIKQYFSTFHFLSSASFKPNFTLSTFQTPQTPYADLFTPFTTSTSHNLHQIMQSSFQTSQKLLCFFPCLITFNFLREIRMWMGRERPKEKHKHEAVLKMLSLFQGVSAISASR